LGLAILLAGLAKLYFFGSKSSSSRFRSSGAYDIALPRLLQRRGRWYLDLGWLSLPSPATTSQHSTPVSSNPHSPVDEHEVPLLHLPFDVQAAPQGASPHSESSAHPILDAVLRMRNRALSSLVGRSPPSSPLTPPATPSRHRRPRGSRGILFFLPAVFTQSQDVELSSFRTNSRPFSRTVTGASTFPPEKQRYAADLEQAGLFGNESEDAQFTNSDITNRSADNTAFSTHGH